MKKQKIVSVLLTTIILAIGISGCRSDIRSYIKAESKTSTDSSVTMPVFESNLIQTSAAEPTRKETSVKKLKQSSKTKQEKQSKQSEDDFCSETELSDDTEYDDFDENDETIQEKEEIQETTSLVEEDEDFENSEEFAEETKWAVVSANTQVDTDSVEYPIDAGTYIRVISEDETSTLYIIEWYGSEAKIPISDVKVLENITPEQEEMILQKRTAGVITG